jgi:predicted nuclease of predicted toxin-antitoxin system
LNIIADENIAFQVVERLRQDGHNVRYTVSGQSIDDRIVLELANQQKTLILTDDKDFGELVIRHREQTSGVMLIRLPGLPPLQKAEIVAYVVEQYGDQLINTICVVTPQKVRIRHLE